MEVTRGHVVESIHRGDIAVVNYKGDLLYYAGDPYKYTYFRSAAKPIQAMQVILSSAYETFRLDHKELAVMCASHFGEKMHRSTVEGILDKIGLKKEHILGGTVSSLNPEIALTQAYDQLTLNPLFSDCSGKHAGFLSVCVKKNYDISNYMKPDHPLQREILATISKICQYPQENIALGIDGCSVPVHAMPLFNMALGYARLGNPVMLDSIDNKAAQDIFIAMNRFPEMVAGTGGFCSDLIRHTNQKLIGKIGAEGIYCIALKEKGLGIAVKIEDGNMQRLPAVVMDIFRQLSVLTDKEKNSLSQYQNMKITNDLGQNTGQIRPVFKLSKA